MSIHRIKKWSVRKLDNPGTVSAPTQETEIFGGTSWKMETVGGIYISS
jgi:hypothetical protein